MTFSPVISIDLEAAGELAARLDRVSQDLRSLAIAHRDDDAVRSARISDALVRFGRATERDREEVGGALAAAVQMLRHAITCFSEWDEGCRPPGLHPPATSIPTPDTRDPSHAIGQAALGEDEAALRERFRTEWRQVGAGDQWGFIYHPAGNCTSYVAWRLNDLARKGDLRAPDGTAWSFHNTRVGGSDVGRLGNAGRWGVTAEKHGFATDREPRPGAVAESDGHVMIVREVRDGKVWFEESSYGSERHPPVLFELREMSYEQAVEKYHFIHFLPGS